MKTKTTILSTWDFFHLQKWNMNKNLRHESKSSAPFYRVHCPYPSDLPKKTHWPEINHHFPHSQHSPKSRGYEPQKPIINTLCSRNPWSLWCLWNHILFMNHHQIIKKTINMGKMKPHIPYSHVFPGFFHVSPMFPPFCRPSSTTVSAACATKKAMKAQHAAASQEGCEARLCKIATFMAW